MYNLTVDEAHTFFVGDGEWLVHNTCGDLNSKLFGKDPLTQKAKRNIFANFEAGDPVRKASDLDVLNNAGMTQAHKNTEWAKVVDAMSPGRWGALGGPDVRSINIRVDSLETAARLLEKARGIKVDVDAIRRNPAALAYVDMGDPNRYWRFDRPEISVPANDMFHLKWVDGKGSGNSGHIFFSFP